MPNKPYSKKELAAMKKAAGATKQKMKEKIGAKLSPAEAAKAKEAVGPRGKVGIPKERIEAARFQSQMVRPRTEITEAERIQAQLKAGMKTRAKARAAAKAKANSKYKKLDLKKLSPAFDRKGK